MELMTLPEQDLSGWYSDPRPTIIQSARKGGVVEMAKYIDIEDTLQAQMQGVPRSEQASRAHEIAEALISELDHLPQSPEKAAEYTAIRDFLEQYDPAIRDINLWAAKNEVKAPSSKLLPAETEAGNYTGRIVRESES